MTATTTIAASVIRKTAAIVALLLLTVTKKGSCSALSSSSGSASSLNKEAVVVGGGPVGLATALTLSNPPHCYCVTVLEKTIQSQATYDPARAYQYNINGRGLQWVDQFPSVRAKLEQRGVSGVFGDICYIPADGNKPIPPPAPVSMGVPVFKKQQQRTSLSFWIPRHKMVELLKESIQEQEAQRQQATNTQDSAAKMGTIRLFKGKQFDNIRVANAKTNELEVTCVDGSTYTAALVVAADGMDSAARARLGAENDKDSSSWLHGHANKFRRLKKYRSPSTGLRMKSLQFPPGFALTNSTGEKIPTRSETMYVFRGVNKGYDYVSLGLLPVKDPTLIRPANINTRPDHVLWTMKTGEEVKSFFQSNFPRVNWDDFVTPQEWDRFAKATGTSYPYCQFSPGSAVASPCGKTGVALVGDACHAFPPDIGQGINAGLQDVVALDRALKGQCITTGVVDVTSSSQPKMLGEALQAYRANRGPEHKALIRLARCGAPYQYRQAWIRDRLGRFFWSCNVAFRILLNKLSFGLIPPAAILLLQDSTLTFRQVMRRAALTSRALKVVLAIAAWLAFQRRVVA